MERAIKKPDKQEVKDVEKQHIKNLRVINKLIENALKAQK